MREPMPARSRSLRGPARRAGASARRRHGRVGPAPSVGRAPGPADAPLPRAPGLSLVIPAHNEAARLPATLRDVVRFLADRPEVTWEILVADNASTDGTGEVVARAADPRIRLLRVDRRGKGLAVRAGLLAARGGVVVFADADRSWPLEALGRFPALLRDGPDVVIGSREGDRARRLAEPAYRHVMGRTFNRLVRLLAVPGVEDTQCGFKAFRAGAARELARRLRTGGFAFDVEL